MISDTRNAVVQQIRKKGRGWVFNALDLTQTADLEVIKDVLRALKMKGKLREVAPDVFHFPRRIGVLNIDVPPEPMRVAKAVARLGGHRVALSGAAAANCLGLSEQVPARPVYLTDGPDAEIPLGKLTIVLQHAPPELVRVGGDLERTLVQALVYLGPDRVDERVIAALKKTVPAKKRRNVVVASERVGGWIGEVLRTVATSADEEAVTHG